MKSQDYKRGGFEIDKQGRECNEKPWKRYLERNKKQPEIYVDQIVAEMSLSEIMAGKHGIKRDAKMGEEYKEIKLHSDGGTFRAVDFVNAVKSVTLSQMEAALKALQHVLAKSSTGKACLGMADHIFVETNGVKIPLSEMADVSLYEPNPHKLSIAPYDPNTIPKLEKAIAESPLGMSPSVSGDRLLALVSWLTFEQEQAVWKLVINTCEQFKQRIRKIRKKARARATIKNSFSKQKEKEKTGLAIAGLSADDVKKMEKEVDEMTKKYSESIEEICNTKFNMIFGW